MELVHILSLLAVFTTAFSWPILNADVDGSEIVEKQNSPRPLNSDEDASRSRLKKKTDLLISYLKGKMGKIQVLHRKYDQKNFNI